MTILRGDTSPQPSWANAPALEVRESRMHRLFSLATLASGSALGLMAMPAMAATVTTDAASHAPAAASLTYAMASLQATSPAPDAAATPAVVTTPAAAATPAPTTAPDPAAPAPAPATTPPADTLPQTEGKAPATPTIAPADTVPTTGTPATAPARHTGADGHDIVVSAKNKAPPGDPLIGINLKSYAAVQAVDKALVGPAAMVYKKTLPSPLRMALHNILVNLREPPVAFAFLVEHKFGKAFETVGRFGINSTLGIAGMMDIAKRKPFHLPWRPNGIADAMGFYGIKPGPYFFLPLIGPTTLRDVIGTTIDRVGFPALYADELRGPAYGLAVTIIGGLDDRVMIDPQVREFREHAPDPYAAMKAFYLTRRQAEIDALHGKPPLKDKPSDYDIPGSPPAAAAPSIAPAATPPAAAPATTTPPAAPVAASPPVGPAAPVATPPATTPAAAPETTPAAPITPPASTPPSPADTPKP